MAEAPRQYTCFDKAWSDYLADDLPASTCLGSRESMQRIPHLLALKDDVDVFLLDGFGVLNTGFDVVAGMPEQIAALQAHGVHCLVLSNGATQTMAATAQKYTELGFQFSADNILTSRDALREGLRKHQARSPHFVWGVSPTAASSHPDLPAELRPLLSKEDYEAVDGFLLLSTLRWSAWHDWMLKKHLQQRMRPVWVANPDVCAPFPGFVSREPGQVGRGVARTLGARVEYFGKPHGNVYELAMARVAELLPSVNKSRVVMVGDSPHTDILGARMAGIKSVLVQDHGLLAGQPLYQRLAEACIWPDYLIAESV